MHHEYIDICQGFYSSKICMQSIYSSHIVLILMIDNPTKVRDYCNTLIFIRI
jgi:hypothetical protein